MSGYPNEAPPPYPGAAGSSYNYSTPSDYAAYPPPVNDLSKAGGPPQPYAPAPVPPAGGYGTQHATVVVAQPTIHLVQTFRDVPVRTRCPHCAADIVTGIHFETGTYAWVICFVLWLVGCGLGCCLIPFCMDGCKDVIHTCPNCRQHLGRYSRM